MLSGPQRIALVSCALVGTVVALTMAYVGSAPRPRAECSMNDTVRYFEPMATYTGEVLATGRLPLWNHYQACGTPLLAMMQTSPVYPGNWPAMLWQGTGLRISTALHLVWGFAGMVLWLSAIGLRLPAIVTGAIVYTTNQAVVHTVCTQSFHYAVSWWPWMFWAAHRLFARPEGRRAATFGLVVGATILTGGMQFVVYGAYALAVYLLFRLIQVAAKRPAAMLPVLAYVAFGGLCGVALSLVQVLPSLEASALSQRSPDGLTVDQILVFGPLGFVPGLRELVTYGSLTYLGPCLLLVAAAILSTKRANLRGAFVTIIVVSWLLVIGVGPVFDAFVTLPTGNWFRGPTRIFLVTVFAAATLAALAVDDALTRDGTRIGRIIALLVLFGALCAVFEGPHRWYLAAIGILVVASGFGPSLPTPHRAAIAWTIPMALLVEALVTAVNPFIQLGDIAKYGGQHAQLIRFLKTRAGMSRVHFRHGFDFSLPVKSGIRHHLYADLDFDAFISRRMTEYWDYMSTGVASGKAFENKNIDLSTRARNLRLLDYLSTRFIIESPWEPFLIPGTNTNLNRHRVIFQSKGYSIVENVGARPRLTVAGRAELSAPGEPLLRRLSADDFPADGTVLVEDAQDVIEAPSGPAGTARFSAYEAETVEVTVDATRPGMLLLNDQMYPGWRATVDGTPARIAQANYLFRGVRVPAGRHVVRFEYRPFPFYLGGALSLLGMAGIAALWIVGRRGAMTSIVTPSSTSGTLPSTSSA